MGYVGMVKLMEEIDKALFNPVWEQVRRPAPWENTARNWQARAIAQMDAEAAKLAADPDGRGSRAPSQENLQLQDGRSRHHRGCDHWRRG